MVVYHYLDGGFNTSEKYESDWIITPTIGENTIHVPNHQPVIVLPVVLTVGISQSGP